MHSVFKRSSYQHLSTRYFQISQMWRGDQYRGKVFFLLANFAIYLILVEFEQSQKENCDTLPSNILLPIAMPSVKQSQNACLKRPCFGKIRCG